MRQFSLVLAICLMAAPAFAGEEMEPDKGDGCGLGWQVTKQKTFLGTTTRGTTNMFVPPTFGMTSGTIGCDQFDFAQNEMPAAHFAVVNHEALKMEMAVGNGEFLSAFAETLGCDDEKALGEMTRDHFDVLTESGSASPVEMYKNVRDRAQSSGICSLS